MVVEEVSAGPEDRVAVDDGGLGLRRSPCRPKESGEGVQDGFPELVGPGTRDFEGINDRRPGGMGEAEALKVGDGGKEEPAEEDGGDSGLGSE